MFYILLDFPRNQTESELKKIKCINNYRSATYQTLSSIPKYWELKCAGFHLWGANFGGKNVKFSELIKPYETPHWIRKLKVEEIQQSGRSWKKYLPWEKKDEKLCEFMSLICVLFFFARKRIKIFWFFGCLSVLLLGEFKYLLVSSSVDLWNSDMWKNRGQ